MIRVSMCVCVFVCLCCKFYVIVCKLNTEIARTKSGCDSHCNTFFFLFFFATLRSYFYCYLSNLNISFAYLQDL
ncbi:hypothetical protein BDF20DRAFT_869699 [Mycotypha africana]|uniref:uncharacterized protein n=1 Tax=Mycotypha africana TaxID=64632 RepID=UPI002300BBD3|nr:uncharacterized protein BDF20DRAFT_869699 [Mycotypha africana]KAI8979464.1 hypothetical protein BDF20DRAFT_869699 [Mycotypha africana]